MGQILYNLFITPIEYFIETVFSSMNYLFDNPGIAIIFVSIAVQLLCFPLYKRADDIQEQERQKQKEMKRWVDHIKNTFKGDERFMMQQAYYREVGYKPIYAIKGSISLLLQIPFFIAAYNFLSGLEILKGETFLGIPDLSAPDGLIHIGALSINLLPVLMTFFNIISGIIYTKGFPIKDKIQTYGLAAIFLVILYQSPSGLVFYWTLNNFFSLFKNVFMKLVKKPMRFLSIVLAAVGVVLPLYLLTFDKFTLKVAVAIHGLSLICYVPLIIYIFAPRIKKLSVLKSGKKFFENIDIKNVNTLFYLTITVMVLLLGLFIPIDVIKISPVEFQSTNYGPAGLIINTVSVYIGLLFVWVNIFYIFSSPKIRKVFALITSIFTATGIVNYLFFAKKLGTMTQMFVYDNKPEFKMTEIALNLAVVCLIAVVVIIAYGKKIEIIKRLNQILCLMLSVLIVIGSVSIKTTLDSELGALEAQKAEIKDGEFEKIIHLSKNGKNVILFMLDRAINGYIPFIFEEKPEMLEMFDGFTYYPNTVSFGGTTNLGTPALFGGYEYTPTEMNKRKDETLRVKHDEAITVLPKLFSDNGYSVSVIDPPYANYTWVSDISIYDEYEGIEAHYAEGLYPSKELERYTYMFEPTQKRSTAFFGLMKTFPVITQKTMYQNGHYWAAEPFTKWVDVFFNRYTVLQNLSNLTSISDGPKNTFTMMQNASPHDTLLFDENYDLPIEKSFVPDLPSRTSADGTVMELSERKQQISHYTTNVASLMRVGEWLDYLKEQGVYDNTKIIIVSDHGFNLDQFNKTRILDEFDMQRFNPLLMIKDFNAHGFTTSDEFMTNADAAVMSVQGVIENPVNPFTGKIIDNSEKTAHPQIITTSKIYDVEPDMGSQFNTSDGEWWSVEKNIFDAKNWKKVGEG